jgi:hypothetical protein
MTEMTRGSALQKDMSIPGRSQDAPPEIRVADHDLLHLIS